MTLNVHVHFFMFTRAPPPHNLESWMFAFFQVADSSSGSSFTTTEALLGVMLCFFLHDLTSTDLLDSYYSINYELYYNIIYYNLILLLSMPG